MFLIGAGAGIPNGDLRNSMSPPAGIRFKYGYRFMRNIQADLGLDWLINAAGISCAEPVAHGSVFPLAANLLCTTGLFRMAF